MTSDQLDDDAAAAADSDGIVDIDEYGKSMTTKVRFKINKPGKVIFSYDDDRKKEKRVRDEDSVKMEEEEYVCSLCGKGFRSRKALGGHMRVHAQQQQQQQRSNDVVVVQDHQALNASSDTMADGDGDGDKAVCCPICDRDFPSNKALFGHMRSHPERSWRGIQPPLPVHNYNNNSSSTVSDVNQPKSGYNDTDVTADVKNHKKNEVKQVVDLENDLLRFRWGAKAIRGRDAVTTTKSSLSSSPCEPPAAAAAAAGLSADMMDVEPEQVDGVESLILLSQSDSCKKLQPAVRGVRDNVNYMTMNPNKKFKTNDDHGAIVPADVNKKSAIHGQIGNMELERYKCTTCNKCFSSHQALGGHNSSHNNNNNNVKTQAQGRCGEAGLTLTMASGGPLHQCNVCFKIFPSGQALGGHKRLHCSTTPSTTFISKTPPPPASLRLRTLLHPNIVTAALPKLPEAPAVVLPDNKRVFRGFDLNEPPPPLEYDDNNTVPPEQQSQTEQEEES